MGGSVHWSMTSSYICQALREELDFWLYGPHPTDPYQDPIVPNEQQIAEFARALFERRGYRLSEAEAMVVRRWVRVQAMKRAIDRRRWLLTSEKNVRLWERLDSVLAQSAGASTAREEPLTFFDLFWGEPLLLGECLYRMAGTTETWPPSPNALLESIIELQTKVLLKGLADYASGDVPEKHRAYWETAVSEMVALEMIEKMPDAVQKAWDIRTSVVKDLPSASVLERLQEAFQCFQYGFYQACIVLCRSVLEHALKERLDNARLPRNLNYMRKNGELAGLIQQAEEARILSPALARWAHEVRERGNKCTHDRGAATSEYCRDTLTKMRHLLARLCS